MPRAIHTLLDPLGPSERDALMAYLRPQRWFRSKARRIVDCRYLDAACLSETPPLYLAVVECRYETRATGDGGHEEIYLMPLHLATAGEPERAIHLLPSEGERIWLVDGGEDGRAAELLAAGIIAGRRWGSVHGEFVAQPVLPVASTVAPLGPARPLRGEQSNSCFLFERRAILKLIRRLEPGVNPDVEILDFLTRRAVFAHVPRLIGHLLYRREGRTAVAAVLQEFVANEGDGWDWALADLRRLAAAPAETTASAEGEVRQRGAFRQLGEITGALHVALAGSDEPAFRAEPITETDVAQWRAAMLCRIDATFRLLAARTDLLPAEPPASLAGLREACASRLTNLGRLLEAGVRKIRLHGDYHLGQVLKVPGRAGFVILDFEGEPARPLEERRAKGCVLKDVAGMLRSFNYAHEVVQQEGAVTAPGARAVLERWEDVARKAFLSGYRETVAAARPELLPDEGFDGALRVFELDKAIYELGYELNNRPTWSAVPLRALQRLSLT